VITVICLSVCHFSPSLSPRLSMHISFYACFQLSAPRAIQRSSPILLAFPSETLVRATVLFSVLVIGGFVSRVINAHVPALDLRSAFVSRRDGEGDGGGWRGAGPEIGTPRACTRRMEVCSRSLPALVTHASSIFKYHGPHATRTARCACDVSCDASILRECELVPRDLPHPRLNLRSADAAGNSIQQRSVHGRKCLPWVSNFAESVDTDISSST